MQAKPAERDGFTPLPWHSALYQAVRALEAQLDVSRKEVVELRVANSQLHAQLQKARTWARDSNANWKLRREAWHRERDELLRRIADRS